MNELLTVRELAARMKISQRQVWKLLSSGRIPAPVRISRSVRWREADIVHWVELGCPTRERFETECAARVGR